MVLSLSSLGVSIFRNTTFPSHLGVIMPENYYQIVNAKCFSSHHPMIGFELFFNNDSQDQKIDIDSPKLPICTIKIKKERPLKHSHFHNSSSVIGTLKVEGFKKLELREQTDFCLAVPVKPWAVLCCWTDPEVIIPKIMLTKHFVLAKFQGNRV